MLNCNHFVWFCLHGSDDGGLRNETQNRTNIVGKRNFQIFDSLTRLQVFFFSEVFSISNDRNTKHLTVSNNIVIGHPREIFDTLEDFLYVTRNCWKNWKKTNGQCWYTINDCFEIFWLAICAVRILEFFRSPLKKAEAVWLIEDTYRLKITGKKMKKVSTPKSCKTFAKSKNGMYANAPKH